MDNFTSSQGTIAENKPFSEHLLSDVDSIQGFLFVFLFFIYFGRRRHLLRNCVGNALLLLQLHPESKSKLFSITPPHEPCWESNMSPAKQRQLQYESAADLKH